MKRLAVAVLALLAVVPGAGAGGYPPVSAIEWRLGGGVTLLRLDATTLKPLPGRRIELGFATRPLALSPNRRQLLATGPNLLRLADLRTGRLAGSLSPGGSVSQAIWTRQGTIVVVTGTRAVLVDPKRMEATRYLELGGEVLASAKAGGRVFLVLGPEDAIGALRIAVVDGAGTIRSAPLPLRGGSATLRNAERNPVGWRSEAPGLAVNGTATRAVVAGRTALVEVDLDSLETATHALALRTPQKSSEGWWRAAAWLDRDHVAISGGEYDADQKPVLAPVRVVDVRDWTARELDVKGAHVVEWRSRLVTFGDSIRVYDAEGNYLSTARAEGSPGQIFAGESFLYLETSGRGTKWVVLDWDGRVMGTRTFARPMNLVEL